MSRAQLAAAAAVVLLAVFLRFHLLEAQSFWNDEGNSARLSERSLPAILEGTASDIHPPLYYLLLRGWRELVGETEFGLRSFSAFAGVLTVAGVYAVGRLLAGRGGPPALVAMLLAAASPVLVYYSQETRMYALLALLALLSTWALLRWLRPRPARAAAVVYVALTAAGLYTHYFYPAVIAAQAVIVALDALARARGDGAADAGGGRRRLLLWSAMVGLAVLLYLPWLPVFLNQVGGREGTAAPLGRFLLETGRWLALGSTVRPTEATWALVAALALVVLGAAAAGRRAVVPLVLAVVPIALMFLVGATDPAFFKFLLVVVPFLAILAGMAWRLTRGARAVPAVLTAVVLAGSAVSLSNLYTDPAFARADYRGMAQRIAAEAGPDAAVILNAPNQWEAFTYYYKDGVPVYPLPRGQADPAVLEPELEEIAGAHDRIYALYWGDAQRDPEHIVELWLDAHAYKASEEWVGDVRFAVYAVPRAAAEAPPASSGAVFQSAAGDIIRLVSYTVWPAQVAPGDIVQVRLIWDAPSATKQPYKVFLHLVDASGAIVAQRDSEPGGGSRPTTGWIPGEAVEDNHGLLVPFGVPAGEYTVRLGLYDAFDPAVRLPVVENGAGDSLELGRVTVAQP